MQILHNAPGGIVVSLSERNLRALLDRMGERGAASQMRLTESGLFLTIIAELDALHYADRPDAMERHGITARVGAVSTPSTAASPEPWGEPMPEADASGARVSEDTAVWGAGE